MTVPHRLIAVTATWVMAATAAFAQGGSTSATPDARAEAGKIIQALKNDAAIHAYTWTETNVVLVDGKDKHTAVNACSYGPEGKVVRTPANAGAAEQMAKGVPGTTGEINGYLSQAVALMRGYVRPRTDKLEECRSAGRVSAVQEAGQRMKLTFKDYLKPGDQLTLEVDTATNHLTALSASTYMTNRADKAEIHTEMSQLPDGTDYPSSIKFATPERAMGVNVTNSDYKKKTS
ncbi:MAG TPA: hypothetical protein VFH33_01075 [Candidatus Krumholzibacteria bacterium]|nr:hypothetical protein [Candidatus Krumholzibacteria bacterium]